ncbi:MAG: glycosyltransferase family 2 protein [Acidobacteria bacterium]|nr:glycosyltransferase family 2 protein [Acidobacteriota bacterium]
MANRLCVVLPTYNEAENVSVLLPLIFAQQPRIPSHELHVLVVDDESPDGTADVVRGMQARFPRLSVVSGPKRGLGEAYKRGIAHAIRELDPELIVEMDADLQHSPDLLPLFATLAGYGFTLVIGSRFAPGGSTPEFSFRRRAMSLVGNWMIRFLGGLPRLHDCTSGYRCINAALLARCDLSALSTRGYSFQSSLLFELLRQGARPIEVPMVFAARAHGESKLALRDQLEFLANIVRIRFRRSTEFVKFCVVGGSGVLVNMGAYVALTRKAGLPLEGASPLAIELSILWNFLCNNSWTFRGRAARSGFLGKLARFHVVSAAAALANYLLLLALVHLFGVWDVLANLVGIAVGTVFNFSMNSLWTWRGLGEQTPPAGDGAPGPPRR